MRQAIAAASLTAALGVLTLLLAAPPALAQGEGDTELQVPERQEIGMLFVQTASRGTLEKVPGRPVLKLKLRGVSPQTVWFQDRPGRGSGQIPNGGFARAWAGFGFADRRPNAALTLLDGRRRADTAVFKLSAPRYRKKKATIRYFARPLSEATGNLAHFESQRDRRVPRRFGAASLFIDNADGQEINGCLIQPYTECIDAQLSQADLARVNLTGAKLTGAHLAGADLTEAELLGVDLSYADLTGAYLAGADLTGAYLYATNLTGADLTSTDGGLTPADLSNANLTRATLSRADLTDANLDGANLTSADVSFANLSRANLTRANLTRADLFGANLTGANLTIAIFCQTEMPDGSVNNDYC
jgi:uncharacterized protein YjbI with pentapeptide repeats